MSRAIDAALVNPQQWLLEISDTSHQNALRMSQPIAQAEVAWQRYLTQVTLDSMRAWLQDEAANITVPIAAEVLSMLNRWITGGAIDWQGKRLIVLPQATLDHSEIIVPQEWLDIPQWQGDYFLVAQVDWDDRNITVWGYTTHQHIKQLGDYVADERMYHLDAVHLIQDLNTLWVTRQLCPDEITQAAIAPLPTLTMDEANTWLAQLCPLTNPRLAVPFATWAALIIQPEWLAQLDRAAAKQGAPATNPAVTSLTTMVTNLGQWFNDVIDDTWQTLDSLMEPSFAPAYAFRDAASSDRPTIRRVKAVRFDAAAALLLLVLTVAPTEDNRLLVQVQLFPGQSGQCLPPQVSLRLCASDREPLQTVSSRAQDNLIQLRQFRCPPGFEFVIQVVQDDGVIDLPFIA